MYITSLQYFIFIFICYSVQRMPSKTDMPTSQTLPMEKIEDSDSKTFEEKKTNLRRIKAYKVTKSLAPTEGYISIECCLMVLYHITSRGVSRGNILATTALFFWKVSAFPLDYTVSTDRTKNTGARKWHGGQHSRKSRSISERDEFSRGDCEKDWFQHVDKCYRVFQEIMNYKTANEYCRSLKSEMVTIKSANENKFIRKLSNNSRVLGNLWISVQKLCMNCTETVGGFSNWLPPRQPSGVSNCVVVNLLGKWLNFDCRYLFAFVCEKAVSESYTETQLLIALLVPVFSCLTVAIIFTTILLISSVRRVGQPFKLASRYGRTTKRERQPTTWDMIDVVRRASLKQRGARLKPRPSAPNIEITKAEITKVDGAKNADNNKPWYKRGGTTETKGLTVPEERRRSSNTSSGGNSSLYELLARLNKMEFEAQNEINDKDIQVQEIELAPNHKTEVKVAFIEDGSGLSVIEDHRQLVETRRNIDDLSNGQSSFRNMAFRDSVVSVETNGSGVARVTSVQQVNQRESLGTMEDIEDITSDTEQPEARHGPRDSPRDNPRDSPCDSPRDENVREDTEVGKKTQTVRADVHVANYADILHSNGNVEEHERKPPSKGKIIWTYSL